MLNRIIAARLISLCSFVAGLISLWQIVRFARGEIDALGYAELVAFYREGMGLPALSSQPIEPFSLVSGIQTVLECLWGVMVWMSITGAIWMAGIDAARIVEVGYSQYKAEEEKYWAMAQRMERIERSRQARRERYRGRVGAKRPTYNDQRRELARTVGRGAP